MSRRDQTDRARFYGNLGGTNLRWPEAHLQRFFLHTSCIVFISFCRDVYVCHLVQLERECSIGPWVCSRCEHAPEQYARKCAPPTPTPHPSIQTYCKSFSLSSGSLSQKTQSLSSRPPYSFTQSHFRRVPCENKHKSNGRTRFFSCGSSLAESASTTYITNRYRI